MLALTTAGLIGSMAAPTARAATSGGLAFLGVSRDNQIDGRLTERVTSKLARMGEALYPRARVKLCKDVSCFKELAQSQPLRRAGQLMNVELYQSDARQQSITVRLYDVTRDKLEETVEACEQCDDESRSSVILSTYARLSRQLGAPPEPDYDGIKGIEDECSNLEGVQREVPTNMTRDRSGRCVPLPPPPAPVDVCPNVPGVQATVPADHVQDAAGNCVAVPMKPTPADACPNLPGLQDGPPAGMILDPAGECVGNEPKGPEQCTNQEGAQVVVPPGTHRDPSSGNCVEEPPKPQDQCLNLKGMQDKVPLGLQRDEHGNCVSALVGKEPLSQSARERFLASSAVFGGMAILSLSVGIVGTILKFNHISLCIKVPQDGRSTQSMVSCQPDWLMIAGYGSAGVFALLSTTLSIPLWKRHSTASSKTR